MPIKKLLLLIIKTYIIYSIIFLLLFTFKIKTNNNALFPKINILIKTTPPNFRHISDKCFYEAEKRLYNNIVYPELEKEEAYAITRNTGIKNIKNQECKQEENKLKYYCPNTYYILKKEIKKYKIKIKKEAGI